MMKKSLSRNAINYILRIKILEYIYQDVWIIAKNFLLLGRKRFLRDTSGSYYIFTIKLNQLIKNPQIPSIQNLILMLNLIFLLLVQNFLKVIWMDINYRLTQMILSLMELNCFLYQPKPIWTTLKIFLKMDLFIQVWFWSSLIFLINFLTSFWIN